MRLSKHFWAYLLCGTLFFIWQTSNSLAIYYMPALTDILYNVFAAHYVAGGIGILVSGFVCDKFIRAGKSRRMFAAALAALSMLCTLSLCFIMDAALYIAVFVIGTFLGFGVNGVILGGLFVALPQAHKALGFGLAFAINVLMRLPIDLAIASGTANNADYSGFAAAAMLLLCAALFIKPVARSFSRRIEEAAAREPMEIGKDAGLMWIAIACGTVVYISFGIFDRLASAAHFQINSPFAIRLTQLLSAAAAGLICMRFGYYTSFISSVSFLGIGTLAYMFGWSGAIGVVCGCATHAGFSLFYHPLRAVFAEIGKRGKYPYTVAAFGFALYFITQVFGIPIADLMDSVGKDSGTVIHVALFMLSIPLIVLLFHKLRSAYSSGRTHRPVTLDPKQKTEAVDALALTRREKEILRMILQGRISREIAEALFVSESTINWHVGNILKKTGAESRAGLIERYKDV